MSSKISDDDSAYNSIFTGKKIMFSLPSKSSDRHNTGKYGERLKHNR
jgi:hypothetical protein